tara:strand:- start:8107 stop:9324 length:1218 start_codon:yes stop_codon:yes gene_type:complete
MVVKFFEDLGIIPNKGTKLEKNINLLQGQDFMYYNRVYNSQEERNAERLQNTLIKPLNRLSKNIVNVEAMQNNNRRHLQLENRFNQKLKEYAERHKMFIEEATRNQLDKKKIEKYLNKVVTLDNETYYYVNKYGYLHLFSNDSWLNRHNSCNLTILRISIDEMNTLAKRSTNINNNQPCNIAGYNVLNSTNNKHAWVDVKGIKHEYEPGFIPSISNACNTREIKSLDNSTYNAIPSGNNLGSNDICSIHDINIELWKDLVTRNNELIRLGKRLNKNIDKLTYTKFNDLNIDNLNSVQSNLNALVNNNSLSPINLDDLQENKEQTINGQNESSKLNVVSKKSNYVLWILFFIIVLVSFLFAIFGNVTYISYSIIAIFAIMIVIYIVGAFTRSNLINYFYQWVNYFI